MGVAYWDPKTSLDKTCRNDNTHFLLMPQKIIQSLPIARHRDHSVEKPQSLARLGVFRTGTGRQASYVAGSPPNLPKKE